MDIKIYVAAHKPYRMPKDSMYMPLCVGAADQEPFCEVTDATGDNISRKNPYYCELTGLYWMWKNADAEYLGLVHYRRHFAGRWFSCDKWKGIITQPEMERVLKKADVITPKPRHYVIETNWSQYAHAHNEADLVRTRKCIEATCPEYLPAFDAVMKRTTGHRFNMMIMKRKIMDEYCTWLFSLLCSLEDRLYIEGNGTCDARVIGFVSERLLDVWLEKNHVAYKELRVVNMESQHWPEKIYHFFQRKWVVHRKEAC